MALIPEATPEPPGLNQRDVWGINSGDINEVLSDRFASWEKGLAFIHEHPETALYGLSVNGSVAPIVGREDHSHNILLQTLLEGGIPALLLYLSIVFYGVYHAFRLWARRNVPFWQRILPLPVFSILLWEMAECLTHFSYGHPPMTLFWFFLGATITVSKSLGKTPKTTEQPAIPAESAVTETGE
jgi:O-antigen ligase